MTSVGFARTNGAYTVRKNRYTGRYMVVHIKDGSIALAGIPTRLRALYVASVLNGWVKEVFNFGDELCAKKV